MDFRAKREHQLLIDLQRPMRRLLCERYGGFPEFGISFSGPNKKDCSILGSVLGFSY